MGLGSLLRHDDHALFHRINAVWTCRALDGFFPWLTDLNRSPWFWVCLAGIAAAWIAAERRRAVVTVPGLALTIGLSDLFCARLLKPHVRRLRPEFILKGVILRAGTHSSYGFPSNHASNLFAAAAFVSLLYPRWTAPMFVLAVLVSYSRVYVGAHFPLDVAGGAVVGAAFGAAGAALARRGLRALDRRPASPAAAEGSGAGSPA